MSLISKLGIGTVQFGMDYGISNAEGQTPEDEVAAILNEAKRNGITLIDTAHAYGNSEQVLGKNDLSSFQIVSKFLLGETGSLLKQFEQSLNLLSVNSIYGYIAHRPQEIIKCKRHWTELRQIQKEGGITKIGFSLNSPEELDSLEHFDPELLQIPYNFLDRRFEPAIQKYHERGCEIHSRSAFLQGLFFMKPETLPVFFEEVKPVIGELQTSAKDNLVGMLLKFVLKQSFIDRVVVGVNNVNQLKWNVEKLATMASIPDLRVTISDNILMPSRWPKF